MNVVVTGWRGFVDRRSRFRTKRVSVANIQTARRLFSWAPQTSFADGLAALATGGEASQRRERP